jgi:hypothetical protein
MFRAAATGFALAAASAHAAAPVTDPPKEAAPSPVPSDAQCAALPRPQTPYPFAPGEQLDYDVDVLMGRAAKLSFTVLPTSGHGQAAEQPVRARAVTTTFFSKVRRVKSQGVSYLHARDLHPRELREDEVEDGVPKNADVKFSPDGNHEVVIDWRRGSAIGQVRQRYANDGLDLIGAIYYFRAIPLKAGEAMCFDVYALRHLWRLWGTVLTKEHVATPAGEFDAFHLAGEAARLDRPDFRRKVHIWISDDAKRLPIAALGEIDLGPVRATLVEVGRVNTRRESAFQKDRPLEW